MVTPDCPKEKKNFLNGENNLKVISNNCKPHDVSNSTTLQVTTRQVLNETPKNGRYSSGKMCWLLIEGIKS